MYKKTFLLTSPKCQHRNWKNPILLTYQLISELGEPFGISYKFNLNILYNNLLFKSVESFASVYKNQDVQEYKTIEKFYKKLHLDMDNISIDEDTAKKAAILIFNCAMKYIHDDHLEIT